MKGFQFQKKDFNLLEEPGTIGISSGCPEESFVSAPSTSLHTVSDNAPHVSPWNQYCYGRRSRLRENNWLFYFNIMLSHESVDIPVGGSLSCKRSGEWKVIGDEGEMCFYCDRCPAKPISLEMATWDPQQRFHPSTTLREDSTSERCSPADSCSTTVKGYTLLYVVPHIVTF